jgi:hypothetical protein
MMMISIDDPVDFLREAPLRTCPNDAARRRPKDLAGITEGLASMP